MINLLIRQNRLSEVSKKIVEKQNRTTLLEEEIKQLGQKLNSIKSDANKSIQMSGFSPESKSNSGLFERK